MLDGIDIPRAAENIASADALLIAAGAGMGVDSGLPDFRGPTGFWRAYPAYERMGLRFEELANPDWFFADPALAWGFYGHRRNLYRRTRPHEGFDILRKWGESKKHGCFVFTSNVDHQFQRAGFPEDRIVEVHGSIEWMQCTKLCGVGIFAAGLADVPVEATTMRALPPLPRCPECGELARPNILMFGDGEWNAERMLAQRQCLGDWLRDVAGDALTLIECGAGAAVPTVRWFSERRLDQQGALLIRINPREPEVPVGHISIPSGALDALRAIEEATH